MGMYVLASGGRHSAQLRVKNHLKHTLKPGQSMKQNRLLVRQNVFALRRCTLVQNITRHIANS
jgi:hypothetical protein